MPLIITQPNTSDLVSMGTEGNITPLFFDGSFIISVFEKWFFKMIETIKHIELCITREIQSVGSGIFLRSCSFFWEERGHWWGEQADIVEKGSQYPVLLWFLQLPSPEMTSGRFHPRRRTSCLQSFYKSLPGTRVMLRALGNSGRALSNHVVKYIKSG